MPPKYGKRDSNHNDIRDAARRMGATVIDTPGCGQTCPGFPDMLWLVWRPSFRTGLWIHYCEVWFVEVKAGPTEPLNDNEEKMRQKIENSGGYYHVVRSVDDVVRMLRRGPQ